jgi:hypothetical protein
MLSPLDPGILRPLCYGNKVRLEQSRSVAQAFAVPLIYHLAQRPAELDANQIPI